MKIALIISFSILLLTSCNESQNNPNSSDKKQPDSLLINKDSTILEISDQVMTYIKNKDYIKLSEQIHPVLGVRFSPYSFIDSLSNVKLSSKEFIELLQNHKKIFWGYYDGRGDSINLSIEDYFTQFVYNQDFLNAENKSLNKILGKGNSINNIQTIYNGCDFTESYFSGFDKNLSGLDWCSLRLVFKTYQGKIYLIGIVHDQWTV